MSLLMLALVGLVGWRARRSLWRMAGDHAEQRWLFGVLALHLGIVALWVPWLPYGNGYHHTAAALHLITSDAGLPWSPGPAYDQHEAWYLVYRLFGPVGVATGSVVVSVLTLIGSFLLWRQFLPALAARLALAAYALAPVALKLAPAGTAKLTLMVATLTVAMLGVELVRSGRRIEGWIWFVAGAWLGLHTHRFGLGQVPLVLALSALSRLSLARALRDPAAWAASLILGLAMVRAISFGNLSDGEIRGEVNWGMTTGALLAPLLFAGLAVAVRLSGERLMAVAFALPALAWAGRAAWFGVELPQLDTHYVRFHLLFDGAFSPGVWIWAGLLGGACLILRTPWTGAAWLVMWAGSLGLVADRWDWGPSFVRGSVPLLWLSAPLVGEGLARWSDRRGLVGGVGLLAVLSCYGGFLTEIFDEQQDLGVFQVVAVRTAAGEPVYTLMQDDLGEQAAGAVFQDVETLLRHPRHQHVFSLTELLGSSEVGPRLVLLDARCHRPLPLVLEREPDQHLEPGAEGLDLLRVGDASVALSLNQRLTRHRPVPIVDLVEQLSCVGELASQPCVLTQGARCLVRRCAEERGEPPVDPSADGFSWPACAETRRRFELEPVKTYRMHDRFFGALNVLGLAPGQEVGLFRIVGARPGVGPRETGDQGAPVGVE